jgi:hypothetical protein
MYHLASGTASIRQDWRWRVALPDACLFDRSEKVRISRRLPLSKFFTEHPKKNFGVMDPSCDRSVSGGG